MSRNFNKEGTNNTANENIRFAAVYGQPIIWMIKHNNTKTTQERIYRDLRQKLYNG